MTREEAKALYLSVFEDDDAHDWDDILTSMREVVGAPSDKEAGRLIEWWGCWDYWDYRHKPQAYARRPQVCARRLRTNWRKMQEEK